MLRDLGGWYAEGRIFNASVIMDKYLSKVLDLQKQISASPEQIFQAYSALAKFCDQNYKQVEEYVNSKEFQEKQLLLQNVSAHVGEM